MSKPWCLPVLKATVATAKQLSQSHIPLPLVPYFSILVHRKTSWKVSVPAVFTSLPFVHSSTHSNLAPFYSTQLKQILSVTSTLPAAKGSTYVSVFTSFSLSEAFNPAGHSLFLEHSICSASLESYSGFLSLTTCSLLVSFTCFFFFSLLNP